MKLHAEISIGWIIVYACLLASLSGKTSIESNVQEDDINSLPKGSIRVEATQFFKPSNDMNDATNKTIDINYSNK